MIGLTFPITVTSGKKSFSALKVIKTFLRSSIQQEYLNSSAFMSTNSEIRKGSKVDKILKNFANVKAQKISLS